MSTRIMLALIAALAVGGAATARADSVDGKPTHRTDRYLPAGERGSPAILFEGGGATPQQGPTQAEQNWMDRASNGGHHTGDTNGY